MPIQGCSSCGGEAVDVMQMLREAQTQQVRVSEALATQNIAMQIDATAVEGIAENIDIAV